MQAFLALLGAVATASACYAAGGLLIDRLNLKLRKPERLPLAFVLGAACLHLVVFAILALHIGYWPVLAVMLLAPISLSVRTGSWGLRGEPAEPLPRSAKILSGLLFGLFTLLYFFHAWAPETSPDGSGYHLGLVSQYLRAHGFKRYINIYAALSGGVEMLFVPAFAIGKHSAAALLHYFFLLALALAMLAYGRRIGKPWAGAVGAFLVYASPVTGIDATSAYNDLAVATIVFAVFYWLEIWDEHFNAKALIPIGLLAGYAYAAKYNACVIALYAIGFVFWRSLKAGRGILLRRILTLSAFAAVMVAPWMLKDWITFHNPIAPFGNRIFRNPYFTVAFEQQYFAYLHRYDLPNLWALPLEATVRGQATSGLVGPVFLAAPLALLGLRFRAGRRLLAAGALVGATYFANVGTRFLIPALPFLALVMAIPLPAAPGFAAAVMAIHALLSWPSIIPRYSAPYPWRLQPVILYKQALRIIPQDRYLREAFPPYSVARMVEFYVPKGERVLSMGSGVAEAYTSREILEGYESAFNATLVDFVNVGWLDNFQPRVSEQFEFPTKALRRIRVIQKDTGRPAEQWSVHELRFFKEGVELPRSPDWRLSAWPNPWQVQLAFDNSQATRWRTWEQVAPGMYIEVDFGKPQALDEVRIERSWDYNLHTGVEIFDETAGAWRELPSRSQTREINPDPNIRREATRELGLRGIHYLLVNDNQAGAKDLREDPEGWGLTFLAESYGARLYRVKP